MDLFWIVLPWVLWGSLILVFLTVVAVVFFGIRRWKPKYRTDYGKRRGSLTGVMNPED